MTLIEVVVSSVVLAGSSSAALGVWNQAATELQRTTQLDALALQLETARITTERWLQSDEASVELLDHTSPDCRFNSAALEAVVAERLPIGSELSTHWSADLQGLGDWLELSVNFQKPSTPLKRRLFFSPAAYDLCPRDEVNS